MKVSCVICGELILNGENVSATHCGHTFHTPCILQWLERSKTCPKCRERASEKSMKKLYFDLWELEGEADPDALQQQLDNLKFQLKLKEQEVTKNMKNAETSNVQNIALREEFRTCERQLRDKDTTILALKTQLKHLSRLEDTAKRDKEETKKVKEELIQFKWLQQALKSNEAEVEEMVKRESRSATGLSTLAALCVSLKNKLSDTVRDRTRLMSSVTVLERRCKDEKTWLVKKRHLEDKIQSLEVDVKLVEEENRSLKKKNRALEQAIASPSDDVRSSALHRLLCESPAPALLQRLYSANISDALTPEAMLKELLPTSGSEEEAKEQDSSDSEVIDLRSPSPLPRKLHIPGTKPTFKKAKASSSASSSSSSSSTTIVRPLSDKYNIMKGRGSQYSSLYSKAGTSSSWNGRRLQGGDVGYDGLGGHHKLDMFPKLNPLQLPLKKTLFKPAMKKADKRQAHRNAITLYLENTFDD